MKRIIILSPIALFVPLFSSCGNSLVPRADYDALAAYADSLKADNDLLHFELKDLMLSTITSHPASTMPEMKKNHGMI